MKGAKLFGAISLALAALACFSAHEADAQQLGRKIGIGHSAGYHAPQPLAMAHAQWEWGGCNAGCVPGCCDIPINWRVNAWADYPNEPLAQRWAGGSLHPAAPVPPPLKTLFKRQAAYRYAGMNGGSCPTCNQQTQPAAAMPVMARIQPAINEQSADETPTPVVVRPATRCCCR
ncbi:MAG TPA: hypothetical protein VHV77_03615 [Pirellulales bacterium]|jgi:hypothetical protein|nr:hypothetical protein [Pirellulales bacterium]